MPDALFRFVERLYGGCHGARRTTPFREQEVLHVSHHRFRGSLAEYEVDTHSTLGLRMYIIVANESVV